MPRGGYRPGAGRPPSARGSTAEPRQSVSPDVDAIAARGIATRLLFVGLVRHLLLRGIITPALVDAWAADAEKAVATHADRLAIGELKRAMTLPR